MARKKKPRSTKMAKTMGEFKEGKLRSGSKSGPKVKSKKQAVAIGLNQARKAGEKVAPPKKPRSSKSMSVEAFEKKHGNDYI
jgi:hypothetical protein